MSSSFLLLCTPTIAGDRPPRYGIPLRFFAEHPPLHRRAWALACHTRMRAGFPRHASICAENGRGLAFGVRVGRVIAGDRPPRYGMPRRFFARDRPSRYGEKNVPFPVGRGPVPRHASICAENGRGLRSVFAYSNDRGGQAPALRYAGAFFRGAPPFTVGRGPVPRRARADHSVRVFQRSRGTGPRATVDEAAPLPRRAWALACHTRLRAGFPRHAAICAGNGRGLRSVFAYSNDRGGQAPALR